MTVSSTVNQTSYAGNGVTTVFAVPFYFLESAHLRVTLIDNATSVGIVQTLNVNYTVTGAGNQAGGSLTMTAAPANGKTLLIVRVVPATQDTDYVSNDPFPAETHERALDKLTMIAQQTSTEVAKSLRVQDYDPDPARLPGVAQRANLLLSFDSNGNPIAVAPVSGSATDLAINLAKQSPAGQEGTNIVGHINRTTYTRLMEDASILDYCTPAQIVAAHAGDFSQDHTSAFIAAFAALQAGTIQSLKINDRCRFKLTDGLSLTGINGFRIYGKGEYRQFTANKRIVLTSCDDFEIRGPRGYGLGTDFTPGVDTGIGDGLYLNNCTNYKVHFCKFTNFGSAGVRTRDGGDFSVDRNVIRGTHGISVNINSGDTYQFGIINQSNWDVGNGPFHFGGQRNKISGVAIGVRVEPKARDISYCGNEFEDIKGNHAFYLNGQRGVCRGNQFLNTEKVNIKGQSFYSASGPTTDAFADWVISGNNGNNFETGISIERTGPLAPKNFNVTIKGNNMFKAATSVGAAILVQATDNVLISGNNLAGGRYGILANEDVGTTDAVTGKISNNLIRDTFGPGILGNTHGKLVVNDNEIWRPCLAAAAGPVDDAAMYLTGTTTGKRVSAKGNELFVDTSTGVNAAIRFINVTASEDSNDLDGKLLDFTGSTVRQRGIYGSFAINRLWGSAPSINNGLTATSTFTVTGAALGDKVVAASYGVDLQGCTIDGYVSAVDVVTMVITNNTGSTQNLADAMTRFEVMRKGL